MRVQDIMTADVVTARRETTLKDAARILAARRISGRVGPALREQLLLEPTLGLLQPRRP